jgi:hypothetical protein
MKTITVKTVFTTTLSRAVLSVLERKRRRFPCSLSQILERSSAGGGAFFRCRRSGNPEVSVTTPPTPRQHDLNVVVVQHYLGQVVVQHDLNVVDLLHDQDQEVTEHDLR